jgi:hypothetical protein
LSTKKNLNTGDLVDTLAVARRFDLTDVQWALLEPLLPLYRAKTREFVCELRFVGGSGGASVFVDHSAQDAMSADRVIE